MFENLDFSEIECKVNENFMQIINSMDEFNKTVYNSNKLGIDERALPLTIWYNDHCLIIEKQFRQRFDYYGGFEYVDDYMVHVVMDYVIYSGEDSRVKTLIEALKTLENLEGDGIND